MGSKSEAVLVSPDFAGQLFHFVMIKPTHYDDDGYPIQWFRSAIPSNTLACLNGLAEDAHRRIREYANLFSYVTYVLRQRNCS